MYAFFKKVPSLLNLKKGKVKGLWFKAKSDQHLLHSPQGPFNAKCHHNAFHVYAHVYAHVYVHVYVQKNPIGISFECFK
jgi:hypothetical protein